MAKLFLDDIHRAVYAVARIKPDGSAILGTAFLVGKGILATAAHVTGGDDRDLVIIINDFTNFSAYQLTAPRPVNFSAVRIRAIDPIRDICILEVDGDLNLNCKISGTDFVVPGQMTATFGYPHADSGRLVLTQHNVQIGAKVMIDAGGTSGKHIVLNTLARPGQSGGPVFDMETEAMVAMILGAYTPSGSGGISLGGIDPASLHQTTHAVSAEYIMKMIS